MTSLGDIFEEHDVIRKTAQHNVKSHTERCVRDVLIVAPERYESRLRNK